MIIATADPTEVDKLATRLVYQIGMRDGPQKIDDADTKRIVRYLREYADYLRALVGGN